MQVERKPSDWNEPHSSCEELYVHISADTYEKVDAAVSVIEVLITSVSVSFVILEITDIFCDLPWISFVLKLFCQFFCI